MNKKLIFFLILACMILLMLADPALAGPGGKIANAVYQSFWGKVLLTALFIIFLPLITYVIIREKLAEKRARKDLRYMARYSAKFEWLKIQERVTDCFYRIHSAWQKEDVSEVSNWMTDWYWQNQQMVYLDKWEKEGLVNVCEVKKISNIYPLLFVHRNDGSEHEDSMVVVAISANMKDYLAKRNTDEVVEGSKKFQDVTTVWSFTLNDGQWKVSNIEEDTMSLAYAKLVSELPPIETTIMEQIRA